MELHLRATECHLPHGITQFYLPLYTSEHTLTPARQASTQFTYRRGMEGWVDLQLVVSMLSCIDQQSCSTLGPVTNRMGDCSLDM